MWMIKTIPFASLISVFSRRLRVASFPARFRFMSSPPWSPCLSSKQGSPLPRSSQSPWPLRLPPSLAGAFSVVRLPFPLATPHSGDQGLGNRPGKLPPPCLPGPRPAPHPAPHSFLEMSALSLPPGAGGWERAVLSAPGSGRRAAARSPRAARP